MSPLPPPVYDTFYSLAFFPLRSGAVMLAHHAVGIAGCAIGAVYVSVSGHCSRARCLKLRSTSHCPLAPPSQAGVFANKLALFGLAIEVFFESCNPLLHVSSW